MGWEEKLTLEGLTYYYNTSTKEVTWDKPDELLSAQEREENQGTWTWVPHAKDVWQPVGILPTHLSPLSSLTQLNFLMRRRRGDRRRTPTAVLTASSRTGRRSPCRRTERWSPPG